LKNPIAQKVLLIYNRKLIRIIFLHHKVIDIDISSPVKAAHIDPPHKKVKEVGHEEERHFGFSLFYCLLFPFHKRKSMLAVLHSNNNSLKSGLLHSTGQL
jgi:hypothetical protein